MGRRGRSAALRSALAQPRPDSLLARERLISLSDGTYLARTIAERDSSVERWPERVERPIRVWIADGAGLRDWQPSYAEQVREAFHDWERAGIPVRFTFVSDSAQAEVRVRWTPSLPAKAAGLTEWTSDSRRWLRSASVQLATEGSDGVPQDEAGIKAIALHEVGHLLGLGHSGSDDDVMAPWVIVNDLSPGDRATIRLLYALPAGRVG